jgi:hypothetical protein
VLLWDKPFWFMLVEKGVHTLSKSFENADMNEWTTWDVVVKGYWYERLQLGSQLYQLRNDKPLAYYFHKFGFSFKV